MDTFKTTDVFTPSKPATLTFVEREVLTEQLVNAIWTPGKQIVVFGHSGSGKTTLLLNKLQQTREFWIRCNCTHDTTLESLVLDAFDKLGPFYRKEISISKSASITSSLTSDYLGIKASIANKVEDRTDQTFERVLPPQLTIQRLIDFLGQSGALWIVDDFHKLPDAEKTRFAQTLKVFVDAASEYDQVKVIAIGAVDTAREVIQYDPEMRNRIAEVHVPLMSADELHQIISIGENRLNCQFPTPYATDITEFSSGLAAVYHQLCLNVCFAAELLQTSPDVKVTFTDQHLKDSIERYVADTSDTLKSTYDRAVYRRRGGKWDNCKLIVQTMAELPQHGAIYSTIIETIHKNKPDYPPGNLTMYLGQLVTEDRSEILRFDATSGMYSFSNPFYRAYAQIVEKRPVPQKKLELSIANEPRWSVRISLNLQQAIQEELDKDSAKWAKKVNERSDKT